MEGEYVKEQYEYCCEDMQCMECGEEIDGGDGCECFCHQLV